MQVLDQAGGEFVVTLEVRSRAFTGLVHRVVAAEQDPVVLREPVVVKLVAGVPDALAARPSDPRQRLRAGSGAVMTTWSKTGTTKAVSRFSSGAWAAVVSATMLASTLPPNVRRDMPTSVEVSAPRRCVRGYARRAPRRPGPTPTETGGIDDTDVRVVDGAQIRGSGPRPASGRHPTIRRSAP